MKFSIAKEHRDFFEKNGFIEFGDLLSAEDVKIINDEIERFFKERFNLAERGLLTRSPEDYYLKGHDLWRFSPLIKNIICKKHFTKIATELTFKTKVRLAFDQLLTAGNTPLKVTNLVNDSHVRGITSGMIICLADHEEEIIPEGENLELVSNLFPHVAGNVTFFNATTDLNSEELSKRLGERFLLVAFADLKALYVLQEKDPHTHTLKSMGYVFGDRLKEEFHPSLLR